MRSLPDVNRARRRVTARRLACTIGGALVLLGGCGREASDRGAGGTTTAARAPAPAPGPPPALAAAIAESERSTVAGLPGGRGHDIVAGNCLVCHSAALITQQRKDTTGWNKTVTQMIAWGAPLPEADRPALVAYLAEHYGAGTGGAAVRPAP